MRSKNPRNLYGEVVEIFRLEGSSGNVVLLYMNARVARPPIGV